MPEAGGEASLAWDWNMRNEKSKSLPGEPGSIWLVVGGWGVCPQGKASISSRALLHHKEGWEKLQVWLVIKAKKVLSCGESAQVFSKKFIWEIPQRHSVSRDLVLFSSIRILSLSSLGDL